jgi:hypothetical protein
MSDPVLIVSRENAQNYTLTAPRGFASYRDEVMKGLFWKHAKHRKGYMFAPSYKSGRWNGKEPVWHPNRIRPGYLQETLDYMAIKGIAWEWADGEMPPKDCLPIDFGEYDFTKEEFVRFTKKLIKKIGPAFKKKNDVDLELRDYQIDAAWYCLTKKVGIIAHATGAGKSFTIALVMGFLFHKKLIDRATVIVPRQMLITQFKNDLSDFGFNKRSIGILFAD